VRLKLHERKKLLRSYSDLNGLPKYRFAHTCTGLHALVTSQLASQSLSLGLMGSSARVVPTPFGLDRDCSGNLPHRLSLSPGGWHLPTWVPSTQTEK
jgi:hypothetical protein